MLEGQNGHFVDFNILTIKRELTCRMMTRGYFYRIIIYFHIYHSAQECNFDFSVEQVVLIGQPLTNQKHLSKLGFCESDQVFSLGSNICLRLNWPIIIKVQGKLCNYETLIECYKYILYDHISQDIRVIHILSFFQNRRHLKVQKKMEDPREEVLTRKVEDH